MFNFSRDDTSIIARWWRNIDKQIFFSITILFLLGLLFSFSSTSSLVGEKLEKDTYFFFIKHLIFVSISLLLFFFISLQEQQTIKKCLLFLFLFSIFLLILVPFIGNEIKGSKRWIEIAFLPRFQPIELVKPLFIIFSANIITSMKNFSLYIRYLFTLLILLSIIFLLINQPDFGQVVLITLSWVTMIFISGFGIYLMIMVGFLFISMFLLVIYLFPLKFGYILSRLNTFFDSSKGDNFQSQKALEAIQQGGLTGQGMGEGVLKDRVPEAHTDYVIAVISEEFGTIFVLVLVYLFAFIAYRVLKKVIEENDDFIKLTLVGLISLLIFQTFIHIGVNTRLLPTTGITLPFISYGGSSLIGSSIIAGVIVNFTRKIPKYYYG